ncbi:MAG: hypothetical protein QM572_03065 [Nocardioides sp.]|uniref:hypothetical protein n=1 Tax=Nocardioides sp. TaxID=35761 RepID=UPI0039E44E8A
MLIPLAEVEGQGFLKEYWSILTDPAHVAVELTLMLIIDVLLVGLAWPMVRNYVNARLQRQHDELDAEHGIHHHDDHVHIDRGAKVIPHDEHPDHA